MDEFRNKLHYSGPDDAVSDDNSKMLDNHRPEQPLNERIVKKSLNVTREVHTDGTM